MSESNRKSNFEVIFEYINKMQLDENSKVIPENIFNESKTNFENHKLKKLYANYGLAHAVGASAMTVGSVVGFLGGPLGFAIGSGAGGLVWSIAGAASTMMDRCVISNKILPQNDIKMYYLYKDFYFSKVVGTNLGKSFKSTINKSVDTVGSLFGKVANETQILIETDLPNKNKQFSKYFPEKFYDTYTDTIKFKIDVVDSLTLFDKAYNFNVIVTGEFKEFELIKIETCTMVPIENFTNAINFDN